MIALMVITMIIMLCSSSASSAAHGALHSHCEKRVHGKQKDRILTVVCAVGSTFTGMFEKGFVGLFRRLSQTEQFGCSGARNQQNICNHKYLHRGATVRML